MSKITRSIRFTGFQMRLLLVIVLGASVFSIGASVAAYYLGQQKAIETSLASLNDLTQAVEKTVAIGAYASDLVLLEEVVEGLARNSLVARVEVYSNNGQILLQSAEVESAANIDSLAARSPYIERALYSPFDVEERIGAIRIFAQPAHIAAASRKEAMTLTVMMIIQASVLALLLYAVVTFLISRPITQLAISLRAMRPGTHERLDIPALHKRDEVGMLMSSANALLDSNAQALERERELRADVEALETQYRQIFDSSSAGIFVLDGNGKLVNSNPTVAKVIGVPLFRLLELQNEDFIKQVFHHAEELQAMQKEATETGETVSKDLELIPRSGRRRWVHCLISVHQAAWRKDNVASQITEGVIYDITERKRAETAALFKAEHDALTGLKNRAASYELIERFLMESTQESTPLSILGIDLDGFKQINDKYGHEAGDNVLIACAQRMQDAVRRSSDMVGRLGGDEFVVVMQNIGPTDKALYITADALLVALAKPIEIRNGINVSIGASIGIACAPLHGNKRKGLLDMADAAMYEVKRTGKNTYAMAKLNR